MLDCFGIMHEPDQRSAFAQRAQVTAPDGVLLLQYHSIVTIVEQGQWNALRHGHFAYYSLTALMYLLSTVGMRVATAWEFDLYGGTVLVAAVHGAAVPDETVKRILATEEALGVTNPDCICRLQHYADRHVDSLRSWLEEEAEAGRTVLGYGAASRAVALFSRAGLDADLLAAVADASVAKQGRRMPGTDIPIVSPDELLAARPDRVLLDAARSTTRAQCDVCPSSTADGRSTANSRSESVSDGRRLERSWRRESADRRRNRAALEKSVDRALLDCAPIEGQRVAHRGDGALDVVIGVGR